MDFLQLFADSAWLTAVSALVGVVVTYFATRNNNKKELAISDRMQLSKDQYQLISELREMMQTQRYEIEELRESMEELQRVNINLTVQNKLLQEQIRELSKRLESDLSLNKNNGVS